MLPQRCVMARFKSEKKKKEPWANPDLAGGVTYPIMPRNRHYGEQLVRECWSLLKYFCSVSSLLSDLPIISPPSSNNLTVMVVSWVYLSCAHQFGHVVANFCLFSCVCVFFPGMLMRISSQFCFFFPHCDSNIQTNLMSERQGVLFREVFYLAILKTKQNKQIKTFSATILNDPCLKNISATQ